VRLGHRHTHGHKMQVFLGTKLPYKNPRILSSNLNRKEPAKADIDRRCPAC
jgi:hypothetical protein